MANRPSSCMDSQTTRRRRYVIASWLRGYAPSPTTGPFDFAALTSDILALIDRWSPGRPVELIGHDWGALITYDVCVTAPELVHGADGHLFRVARPGRP